MKVLSKEELLSRRTAIQTGHVVYVLFKEDEIVYVGHTANITQRIATHYNNGNMDFDSYAVVEIPQHENVLVCRDAEAAYIKAHCPKLNKCHNPYKPQLKRWNAKRFMAN